MFFDNFEEDGCAVVEYFFIFPSILEEPDGIHEYFGDDFGVECHFLNYCECFSFELEVGDFEVCGFGEGEAFF